MKIKLLPQNIEIDGDPNKSLLQICHENNVHIYSLCKGVPKCAECRVKIVGGEHNVLPPTQGELAVIGNNYYLDGRRLSCQVRAFGDITVDMTEQVQRSESQSKKVRGFRVAGGKGQQPESHAVVDTLVLKDSDKEASKSTEKGREKK